MAATELDRAAVTPYLLFLVAVVTLGPLQFGFHLVELNAPQKALRCLDDSKLGWTGLWHINRKSEGSLPSCIHMKSAEFALVTSIYTLGGFLGAIFAGPFSSRRGRRLPLRLTAPCFFFGSLLEAFAPSITIMAIGRFLAGIGAGASVVVGPVYLSEISPPHLKGTIGAWTQIMTNVGILLSQILGYFLSHDSMWRLVLGSGAIISVVHSLGLSKLVESHEWLGANNQLEAARTTLHRIRDGHLSEAESAKWRAIEADDEHTSLLPSSPMSPSIVAAYDGKGNEPIGIIAVIRHADHWKAVVAVIAVMLAQQLCGINSVMMYSVSFLSGLLPTAAGLITVAVGALNLVVTATCAPLADKLGRKPCLLLSIAGMAINALLLAFSMMHGVRILSAVATLLFVASFAVGLGPIPFILASELVGPEAVGATQSLALGASWSSTFVVAQFFPMLNSTMGRGQVFFVFAALALFFFCFIAWWVPETRGRANADEVWGRQRRED